MGYTGSSCSIRAGENRSFSPRKSIASQAPPSYAQVCTWDEVEQQVAMSEDNVCSTTRFAGRHKSYPRSVSVDEHRIVHLRVKGRRSSTGTSSRYSHESRRFSSISRAPRKNTLPIALRTEEMIPFQRELFIKLFMEYKKRRCFFLSKIWRKNWFQKYTFISFKPEIILKYEIVTTLEVRSRIMEEEPYYPETFSDVDDSSYTSEWDVKVNVSRDGRPVKKKIPGSSSVSDCYSCSGEGSIPCSRCKGDGQHQCDSCNGSGHCHRSSTHSEVSHVSHRSETRHSFHSETCHECHGATYIRCHFCHGKCKKPCSKCNGTGQLEWSSQVVVQWPSIKDSFYSISPRLPICEKNLKGCKGLKRFEEEAEYGVLPQLSDDICSEKELVRQSRYAIKNHWERSQGAVIRSQRHCIRKIPVFVAQYKSGPSTCKSLLVVGTNYKIFNIPT